MSHRVALVMCVAAALAWSASGCLGLDEALDDCLADAGCGGDGGPPPAPDGGPDAGPDAGPDGGPPDGGPDGGSPDGGPDAGPSAWAPGTTMQISVTAQNLLNGVCSGPVTVNFVLPDGGPSLALQSTTATLSGSVGNLFFNGLGCSGAPSPTYNVAAGSSFALGSFRPQNPGDFMLSATSPGLTNASSPTVHSVRPNVVHGTCDIPSNFTMSPLCDLLAPVDMTKAFLLFTANQGGNLTTSAGLAVCQYVAGPTTKVQCQRMLGDPTMPIAISYQSVEHRNLKVSRTRLNCAGNMSNLSISISPTVVAGSSFTLHSAALQGGDIYTDAFFAATSLSSNQVTLQSSANCPIMSIVDVQVVDLTNLGATVDKDSMGAMPGATLLKTMPFTPGAAPMLLYSYRVNGSADTAMCGRMVRGDFDLGMNHVRFSRGLGVAGPCSNMSISDIRYQVVNWPAGWSVAQQDFDLPNGVNGDGQNVLNADASKTFIIGGGQWSNGVSTGEGDVTTPATPGAMQATFTATQTGMNVGVMAFRNHTAGHSHFTAQIVKLVP